MRAGSMNYVVCACAICCAAAFYMIGISVNAAAEPDMGYAVYRLAAR